MLCICIYIYILVSPASCKKTICLQGHLATAHLFFRCICTIFLYILHHYQGIAQSSVHQEHKKTFFLFIGVRLYTLIPDMISLPLKEAHYVLLKLLENIILTVSESINKYSFKGYINYSKPAAACQSGLIRFFTTPPYEKC